MNGKNFFFILYFTLLDFKLTTKVEFIEKTKTIMPGGGGGQYCPPNL